MPASSRLSRPRISTWSWRLDGDASSFERACALLSGDEQARGRCFATAVLRQRFVFARSRVRVLLGERLGMEPQRLVFAQNEFGKPHVVQAPSLHFSLSHSDDRALLAVSDTLEVGADLERLRTLEHIDLARRYFHPDEVAEIEGRRGDGERREAFFRIWTLKEAVVKALGTGLSFPLDGFALSIAAEPPVMTRAPGNDRQPWWLHQTAGDGYIRALAASGDAEVELIQRTV